ncbi:adhesion G protein-coupled receptor A3 isoform X2 [Conger conger]|uniref:adhesion G protein-coupled receptor A3 isoform X2 n=1 Tax=Conger conger TaxID=82655 RepID=UPI002A5A71C1|nr:adhesion G protein-coupled receptor A3 isoform X2 [Conger conger]
MRVHIADVLRVIAFLFLTSDGLTISSDCKTSEERQRNTGKGSSPAATLERVVCSNMDLDQVLPSDSFTNRTVTLDVRNNTISHMEPGAFSGLLALKRLDLSSNRIGCLNADVFKGLSNLVRLNLSANLFSSLSQGTFDSLVSLKTLEFQTQYLLCDCNLRWLLQWIKEKNVGVKDTRCSYPRSLQGQLVTALKPELLTCDAPLELPSFQMTPSQRQIVFRGDSLPFQCMASYIDEDMQVLWYQDGRMVEPDAAQGIVIEKSMVQNCSLIASALTISNIQPGSTGNWECRVRTSRGNNTRTVHIVVLESSAKYCAPERLSNNKGEFRWPRTLAGITAYLACNRLASSTGLYSGSSADDRRAWRRCDRGGFWAEDDYSRCQYQKDVTRVLYIINQMPLNLTNAVTTARQLLVYTMEAANFSDKMDVIFVAQMIEKFGKFAEKYKELGDVMVDISSNLMLAEERVLWMAQREARACSRIVECLQRIASHRLASGVQAYSTNSPNIALEAHTIKASSFNGMTCTLFQKLTPERAGLRELGARDPDMNLDKQLSFKCNVSSTLSNLALKNTIVEASLQLPASLFSQYSGQAEETFYKLHLLAFRNGKLFPATGNSTQLADQGKRRSVATPVILTKIEGYPLRNLRVPVNATLRRFAHGADAAAAYWNFSLLGGQGGWESEGCRVLHSDDNFTTISCNSLNNYGVLMDLSRGEYVYPSADLLHPVIYATAIILLLCLLAIIVSYIYHHRSVRISRKCWHMLINLCFHIFLTCGVFIGGITQTRHTSVCQAVGIVLHYSTLATVLWAGVTARNIYKQVTRKAKRYEELDEPPPPPRPMLRFYLIGGGIPIIVCGITAAANIKNYGSRANAPFCWMGWEPSLGAFYGPAAFIIFVNCMYFLSVAVQLRRHPERRFELKEAGEEQQRLAPSEQGEAPAPDSASVSQGDCSAVSLSALENEHTFPAQLLGVGLALLLFVALWLFGALAVSQEYPADLAFSCLFGVAALGLGGFLVAHHCVNRDDMRRYWVTACCPGRREYSVQVNVAPPGPGAGAEEAPKCPNGSAESSCTNKSASSLKNSSQGCKLTNLQAEAAQCKPPSAPAPAPSNGAALLDNSLTEHSVDNEIKMHVSPVEVQFRPNGHPGRHHKSRTRAHRASRLTVLREYAYDVPTSVEGSVQSAGPHRARHAGPEGHARSRRAAYLAYRGRQHGHAQQDSSDASASLPRRCRSRGGGGGAGEGGREAAAGGEAETHSGGTSNASKDSLKQSITVDLEAQPKSYGLNLANQNPANQNLANQNPANQNGQLKDSRQGAPLLGSDGNAGNIKTGLWKHETTV